MSKKPSRRPPAKQANDLTEEGLMAAMTEMRDETPPPTTKPAPTLTSDLLASVRQASMRASNDTAHNIAELESWVSEINATIAFLRSQRK